jgi:hypothetical protein
MKWAEVHQTPAVYLERGNKIIQLIQKDGQTESHVSRLDAHVSDSISPLDLVRCQLVDSEIFSEGEKITLNQNGKAVVVDKVDTAKHSNPLELLNIAGNVRRNQPIEGDNLEYLTAWALLALGVKAISRGIELKEKDQKGPHAEIDLILITTGICGFVIVRTENPVIGWCALCRKNSAATQMLAIA